MNRDQFIQQNHVQKFIRWLITDLPIRQFFLRIPNSRFVTGGLNVNVNGFPSLLGYYRWSSYWVNPLDQMRVTSESWPETRQSLGRLRTLLQGALAASNEDATLEACQSVLQWGGVRGANRFLLNLRQQQGLCQYLNSVIPLLSLTNNQRLSQLNANTINRFDSGLTKIHALIDSSGSPIYDTRVGASAAMLYALSRPEHPTLRFPTGAARGNQIRNPGEFGYQSAPQFFTNGVSDADWAQWQVKLGWIIRAVLSDGSTKSWFPGENSIEEKCHAFEACLFMAGYDLRCFCPEKVGQHFTQTGAKSTTTRTQLAPTQEEQTIVCTHGSNWVPAGHPFTNVIDLYLAYRRATPNISLAEFRKWLLDTHPFAPGTANAYCFPLRTNEFNLVDFTNDELEVIQAGGEAGLYLAYGSESFQLGDEREMVCLVDVLITGLCYRYFNKFNDRSSWIIQQGYAGTRNAVNTLMAVGKNVGRHFDLLENDNTPTELFNIFFEDVLIDFTPQK